MGTLETKFNKTSRYDSLMVLVPDLFTDKYKSVLNIGAHKGRFEFGDMYEKAGYDITILEIYKPNVDYLRGLNKWKVLCGDILTYNFDEKFDVVFWWHGPEHIDREQLSEATKKLESITNHLVIMGCPWGIYKQGVCYGNEHEIHRTYYGVDEFTNLGYDCLTIGTKDVMGSNITSVKYVR